MMALAKLCEINQKRLVKGEIGGKDSAEDDAH